MAGELIARIGLHKCARVHFPDGCKDANDVLLAFGVGVRRPVASASTPKIEGISTPADFMGDVWDNRFNNGLMGSRSPGCRSYRTTFASSPDSAHVHRDRRIGQEFRSGRSC